MNVMDIIFLIYHILILMIKVHFIYYYFQIIKSYKFKTYEKYLVKKDLKIIIYQQDFMYFKFKLYIFLIKIIFIIKINLILLNLNLQALMFFYIQKDILIKIMLNQMFIIIIVHFLLLINYLLIIFNSYY